MSGSPRSPASRRPSAWSATTRRTRRPRSTSTSSTSSSCRSSNPDGGHAAFHDNSAQRKNLTNYCAADVVRATTSPAATRGASTSTATTPSARSSTASPARSSSCTSDDVLGPVRGLRAGDPQRALDRGHVQGHQVREQHPHPRRLLHVGAGRVQVGGPRDAAGAEHRHRELLLRRRGHDPVAHQVLAEHGDPAAARGPDRRHAVLGGRQLGRRAVLQPRHHRLLVRGRRAAHHGQPDDGRDHPHRGRLPAVLRTALAPAAAHEHVLRHAAPIRTRCWSTRATTPRWSSPRATTA